MTSCRALFAASILTLAPCLPLQAAANVLPRRPSLGVQLQPSPAAPGAVVAAIFPGGTGEALRVQTGDVITGVNGTAVRTPAELVTAARSLPGDRPVTLTLLRAGKTMTLKGAPRPKPLEHYAGATVDYGAVPFRDGQLRDILVMPAAQPNAPVVFYIQGYTCASMEASAADPFGKQIGDALIAHGLGYYRVEKIGVGDSIGSLQCRDVDFATELDGFKAAYRHLIEGRKIAPDRIVMLGHSMGGLQAPMLAAERAPRGVAVYGTVVRNWADYHQDLSQAQEFLIAGQDPVDTAQRGDTRREAIRQFYFEKKSPKDIAAANPANGQALREIANWDGGDLMFGRSYRFAQDLSSLPLLQAWKDSKTNVLAMYGESDMVALTDVDHRYLADIANYWRPGSGTFVQIPKTDHPMNLVGTRDEVRAAYRAGTPPRGTFNPKVVDALAAWIETIMAKAPVSTS